MTSIEDTFSSDSSSSSFSSLSALANNLPALRIESENEIESSTTTVAATVIADTTNASLIDDKKIVSLEVPAKTKLPRTSIDSTNFYADNVNYGDLENTSLADLKNSMIKRHKKMENPNIELAEKLNKPIVEFLDLDTKTCRINSFVIDYSKNNKQVNF